MALTFAKGGWRPPAATGARSWFRVEKMRHPRGDGSVVRYNDDIEIRDIPDAVWDYEVNGKAALTWVMERQGVKEDSKSGIVNDANDYAVKTMGGPSFPLKLLARVIRMSMETVSIINGLPEPSL